jgi:nitrate/nitrite transporter NarK
MPQSNYWFPAKRYGWGWGLPKSWQGWVVMAAFFALVAASAYVFLPAHRTAAFLVCTVLLTVVLVAICAVKGEPPSWRSGK